MTTLTKTMIVIDPETRTLLALLAEHDKEPGVGPNRSRTIRKMIREKAAALGIVTTTEPTKTAPKRKTAA